MQNNVIINFFKNIFFDLEFGDNVAIKTINKHTYLGWFRPNTKADFEYQLDIAKSHGRKVCFPVDYSLWNKHKICTYKDSRFCEEFIDTLVSKSSFDIDWVNTIEEVEEVKYFTYFREPDEVQKIANFTESKYNTLTNEFEIIDFKPSLFQLPELYKIYSLSSKLFADHIGFEAVTFVDFLLIQLFFQSKPNYIEQRTIVLRNKSNSVIGFCSYYIDTNKNHMYIKTIGIDDSFQKRGLSNIFIHYFHKIATQKKIKKVFYLFIKEQNEVDKMNKMGAKLVSIHSLFVLE